MALRHAVRVILFSPFLIIPLLAHFYLLVALTRGIDGQSLWTLQTTMFFRKWESVGYTSACTLSLKGYINRFIHSQNTRHEICEIGFRHCALPRRGEHTFMTQHITSVYLSQYLTNLVHKICFTISFISCLHMFHLLWNKLCASSWLYTEMSIYKSEGKYCVTLTPS